MILVYESHGQDCRYKQLPDVCSTISQKYGTGGGNAPIVIEPISFRDDVTIKVDNAGKAFTLGARDFKGVQCVSTAISTHKQYFHTEAQTEFVASLVATDYKDPPTVTEISNNEESMENEERTSIVRRLTPDECASLQGFPRNWCNIGDWVDSKGKLHKDSDSPKYKAYGNSIAVGYDNHQSGFWCWLARRICAQYERQITMGSLFDGIGGFPLAFSACGAIPVWASEIEEFPIAVTKAHFPEADEERND